VAVIGLPFTCMKRSGIAGTPGAIWRRRAGEPANAALARAETQPGPDPSTYLTSGTALEIGAAARERMSNNICQLPWQENK
jgi:hypothetical protein